MALYLIGRSSKLPNLEKIYHTQVIGSQSHDLYCFYCFHLKLVETRNNLTLNLRKNN